MQPTAGALIAEAGVGWADLARRQPADLPAKPSLGTRPKTVNGPEALIKGGLLGLKAGALEGFVFVDGDTDAIPIVELHIDGRLSQTELASLRDADGSMRFRFPLGDISGTDGFEATLYALGRDKPLDGTPVRIERRGSVFELGSATAAGTTPAVAKTYDQWVRHYDWADGRNAGEAACFAMARAEELPSITIIVLPGAAADSDGARATAASIAAQIYPHFDVVAPEGCEALTLPGKTGFADAALLSSLLQRAAGRYVTVVRLGDRLSQVALLLGATVLMEGGAQFVYSDEDRIGADGKRSNPYFKPTWDTDLAAVQDYVCRSAFAETKTLLSVVGTERADWGGLYCGLLRLVRLSGADKVSRCPYVLYHAAEDDQDAMRFDARSAASAQAILEGLSGRRPAITIDAAGRLQVAWPVGAEAPLVSLLIPTRDRVDLLRNCIGGILGGTDYPAIEIVVIDNDSREQETLDYFEEIQADPRVKVLHKPGPFNYSDINNAGAAMASGSVIGLINNDIEVIGPDWLTIMTGHALRHDVGAVGARLLYGDKTIQHAGCVLGIGGVASHIFKREAADAPGFRGWLQTTREYCAVTAACMVMRREVFEAVGGLAVDFPVAYNDIDFCLRVREAGYRIIYAADACLFHLESISRGRDEDSERRARLDQDKQRMLARWGTIINDDPFYSPNLSLKSVNCLPAAPSRTTPPWLSGAL